MTELLQRYIKGDASEEEKQRIIRWLEESPENMHEYMALRKLYDISVWHADTCPVNRQTQKVYLRRIIVETLKIAAILLIGFAGAWHLFSRQPDAPSMQTVHVPSGQRAELTLSDGTKVWLNARSTLIFPSHFNDRNRKVQLDGEGYFTVTRNEAAPFTVQTARYDIRVLGTEFNVKAYKDSPLFETALLKGSVVVETPDRKQTLRLQPNQIASAHNGQLSTASIPDYNYFRWKDGIFCFENETIENLIEKIQLYYDVKIEVKNTALLPYRYSGKFRIKDGIEHVLKVLQLKHNFTYTKNEDLNLITIQ